MLEGLRVILAEEVAHDCVDILVCYGIEGVPAGVEIRMSGCALAVADADQTIDLDEIPTVAIDTHPEDSYQNLVDSDYDGICHRIDWIHLLFVLLPY